MRPCNCGDCRRGRYWRAYQQLGVVISVLIAALVVMETCK